MAGLFGFLTPPGTPALCCLPFEPSLERKSL